jgi:hypothetical protein
MALRNTAILVMPRNKAGTFLFSRFQQIEFPLIPQMSLLSHNSSKNIAIFSPNKLIIVFNISGKINLAKEYVYQSFTKNIFLLNYFFSPWDFGMRKRTC